MTRMAVNQYTINIGSGPSHVQAEIKASLRSHRKSQLGEFTSQLLTRTQTYRGAVAWLSDLSIGADIYIFQGSQAWVAGP